MNHKLLYALRITAGFLILAFLLYKLDVKEVYQTVLKFNFIAIILIFLHYLTTVFFNTAALSVLANASNSKIKFPILLKHYLLSFSIGRFTPARIGEFSLVYFLSKGKGNYGKATLITVLHKLIIVITLAIFGIFGFFLFFPENALSMTILIIVVLVIISFLIISSRARGIIKKYVLKKKTSKFKGFSKGLFYIMKKKKLMLGLCFLVIILRIFLTAFIIYLLFLSFNIEVPIPIIAIINALGLIVTFIPISISGLGVREATIVFLYSKLGIEVVISGSIYLLLAFFHYIICGIILLLFINRRFFKKKFIGYLTRQAH